MKFEFVLQGTPQPGVSCECLENECWVRVAAGVTVQDPVHLVFAPGAEVTAIRVRIEVGEGASVSVVEEWRAREGAQADLQVFREVSAQAHAQLKWFNVQKLDKNIKLVDHTVVKAEAAAQIQWVPVVFGTEQTRHRIEAECLGRHSRIEVCGVTEASGSQKQEFQISAVHRVPDTSSQVDFRAVASGTAKVVFNGHLVITETALRTKAHQKNRNLILSRTASVDTFPKLDIATDEVECSHGASVSPVSIDQLYYLESRGIEPSEAERMIVLGFIESVLNLIPKLPGREAQSWME